ncbi:SH3 domain-containing protein [Leptospira adleri]|uniref:Peptide-binding protein n=1 Tax=Leptospira adleri TaxID=2023186 RepID=A0A2M9YQI1_9LEPT|nr:SH3 domain-containing protein [Leptospira adleri]PJZ53798.1 peptide-binding protein [Leptospira adleri]PJZ61047.1 peptide-binding protein [Leptospira adleri]
MQRTHSQSQSVLLKNALAILLLISSHFVFAEDKLSLRYVITSEGKLNVREKPKDGKILFQLEKGESVWVKEDTQLEEWQEIKTKTGAKGFAASEFLSKKKPEELSDAKLFGSIKSGSEGSWFRSLAIRIKNQWFSASDYSAEAYFLEKKKIQDKEKAAAYERSNVAGEFLPETKETTGCQENRVIKGNFNAFRKIDTYHDSVFAIFGSKIGDKVKADRYNPSEKVSKILDASANSIFKKKHPNKAELKFLKRGDFYTIDSPGKKYLFVRYAVKKDPEEKSYYAAIHEFNGDEPGKIIFEKFDILMNELTFYGGQYHFIDALDLDENGTPILILHHNGYDGYINEFARIISGKLQTMFLSGGDAC